MRSTLGPLNISVVFCAFACISLASFGGCKHKKDRNGPLEAPVGASAFETRYLVAFDGRYTHTPLEMGGRAPNDVMDQRLFAARVGHADLVLEVTVMQVWGRGRFQGRPEQYLDVKLGDVLMGELPKRTAKEQLLEIDSDSDMARVVEGQRMLLFLRWAPALEPSYRHHLMPRDEEILTLLDAMVAHAEEAGVPVVGSKKARRKAKKRRKREKKQNKEYKGSTEGEDPKP